MSYTATPNAHMCEFCPDKTREGSARFEQSLAVTRVPGGSREWACQYHAEAFYRGMISTAAALADLRRQVSDALDAEHTAAEDLGLACVVEGIPVGTSPA
jgi:hypothetical protein